MGLGLHDEMPDASGRQSLLLFPIPKKEGKVYCFLPRKSKSIFCYEG